MQITQIVSIQYHNNGNSAVELSIAVELSNSIDRFWNPEFEYYLFNDVFILYVNST